MSLNPIFFRRGRPRCASQRLLSSEPFVGPCSWCYRVFLKKLFAKFFQIKIKGKRSPIVSILLRWKLSGKKGAAIFFSKRSLVVVEREVFVDVLPTGTRRWFSFHGSYFLVAFFFFGRCGHGMHRLEQWRRSVAAGAAVPQHARRVRAHLGRPQRRAPLRLVLQGHRLLAARRPTQRKGNRSPASKWIAIKYSVLVKRAKGDPGLPIGQCNQYYFALAICVFRYSMNWSYQEEIAIIFNIMYRSICQRKANFNDTIN